MQFRFVEPQPISVRLARGTPAYVGTPPKAVRDFAGPWRVDERWRAAETARDDYDVALEDGTICRISHTNNTWTLVGYFD